MALKAIKNNFKIYLNNCISSSVIFQQNITVFYIILNILPKINLKWNKNIHIMLTYTRGLYIMPNYGKKILIKKE